MNEQKQIAQDAVFQMACAMEHLNWLRGVLHVLRDQLDRRNDGHYATVADLALFNANDWHNQLDCEMETLEARIATAFVEVEATPQTTQYENVARIPLADFAKGHQRQAARQLGVSATTISKALRLKRNVFVTPHADGSTTAMEECPFPRGHSGGGAQ